MGIKNMEDLRAIVKRAIDSQKPLGLLIKMPGFPEPELITNPTINLKKKLEYWEKTYDENLEHKHAEGIKIVGYTL